MCEFSNDLFLLLLLVVGSIIRNWLEKKACVFFNFPPHEWQTSKIGSAWFCSIPFFFFIIIAEWAFVYWDFPFQCSDHNATVTLFSPVFSALESRRQH